MATRCSILDAAERVFFEQGVARTTLADIAAAAHVTRGAIYWHFANKLELFKAMQDRAMLPQEKFFHGRDIAGSEGCLERLYETTLEALRFIAADEKAKRVYTILLFRCEYVGEIEEALLRRREADERMKAVIVAVFERACREGRLRPAWEPSMAANVYLCALTGLLSEWLRLDGCFDVVETGRRMLDGLFESFGAGTFMQDIGDPVSPEA